MKKRAVLLLIVVMLAAGCGKSGTKSEIKKQEDKPVKTALLENKAIIQVIDGNGEADPIQEAPAITETGGYIKDIKKNNGAFVKKGDVVLLMQDSATEQSYSNAYANYLLAKSNLDKAKKFAEREYVNSEVRARESYNAAKRAYDKAKRGSEKEDIEKAKLSVEMEKKNYEFVKQTHEKNIKLYEKELISEQEFLNSETQFKSSENSYKIAKETLARVERGTVQEDLDQLKSNMENAKSSYELAKRYKDDGAWKYDVQSAESAYIAAEANYKYAKERYENLKLKSPVTGIIVDLTAKEGDRIEKDTTIFTVVNSSFMKFEMGVSGKDLHGISVGSRAEIYIDDLNKSFEGKVYEINPSADKDSKKFKVKVKVENSEDAIKKRMYGKVKISGEPYNGMLVPAESIVIQNLNSYIYVVDASGKARKVNINLGATQDKYQEVISADIKSGEKVVIEGQFLLQDGDITKEVK